MSSHFTESFPRKLFRSKSFRQYVYVASEIFPCSEAPFERIIDPSVSAHTSGCKTHYCEQIQELILSY